VLAGTTYTYRVRPANAVGPSGYSNAFTVAVPTQHQLPPLAGSWRLIFADEFDGAALDPVWHTAQYWDHAYTVVGQGELQAYDATGVSVGGGALHLTARPEAKYAGAPYVSGLVQAGGDDWVSGEPRFSFLHGYLEVRAKFPAGRGLFPAVWMMPASYDDDNGELDVMELIGSDPTRGNFTLHRHGRTDGNEWAGPDFTRGFHTFGVDWQAGHVAWYVDGVERARSTDPALICPEAMYPILNLAVGGDWAGPPDAATAFPAAMDVDYLRVWQQG
jgi:beta-glucanase (GH16 family)